MRKQSLSSKALIIGIGKAINLLNTIVLGMILARLLSQNDYGSYRQVWLIYRIFFAILLMGIPPSVYYFIPKLNPQEKRGFILQTIISLLLLGSISAGLIFLLAPIISSRFNNPNLLRLLRIFAIYSILAFPLTIFDPLLVSVDKIKEIAIFSVLSIFVLSISVLLPLCLGGNLLNAFSSIVLFAFPQTCIVLWYSFRVVKCSGLSWNIKLLREQTKFSLPVWGSESLEKVADQLDRMIISMYYTASEFAIYSNGALDIPFISIIFSSVITVLIPQFVRLYQQDSDAARAELLVLWNAAARKLALIVFPIFAILFVLAKPLIITLYTKTYIESVIIFRIYLFLMPLRIAQYRSCLLASGFTRLILNGSLIYLALIFPISLFAIYTLGFMGPAIAYVICFYILSFYLLLKTISILKVGFSKIFPWLELLKIMLISCVSGAIVYPLSFLNLHKIVHLSVGLLLFAAIYLFLLIRLRILREQEFKGLIRWIESIINYRRIV